MKDWDDLIEELGLTDEELEEMESEFLEQQAESGVELELQFYAHICDCEDFHILSIPDSEGYYPDMDEVNKVRREVQLLGSTLLYRISHGKFATIYSPKTGKVGIMPEDNPDGFSC